MSTRLIGSRLRGEGIPARSRVTIKDEVSICGICVKESRTRQREATMRNIASVKEHSGYGRSYAGDREQPASRETREEGRALSLLLSSPPSAATDTGEIDRIWTIPPPFKTDEELSGRSLCL